MSQYYIYFMNRGEGSYQAGVAANPKALLRVVRKEYSQAFYVYVFPYSRWMVTKIGKFVGKLTQADLKIYCDAGPKKAHGWLDLVLGLPPLTASLKEYEEHKNELNNL